MQSRRFLSKTAALGCLFLEEVTSQACRIKSYIRQGGMWLFYLLMQNPATQRLFKAKKRFN